MTEEEFEAAYIASHPGTVFGVTHVVMPCHCDYASKPHLAGIRNTPEHIQLHIEHDALCKELYHSTEREAP